MKYVLFTTLLGSAAGLVTGWIKTQPATHPAEQEVAKRALAYGRRVWTCLVSAGIWGITFATLSFTCFLLIIF
jgi:hypothetical protein